MQLPSPVGPTPSVPEPTQAPLNLVLDATIVRITRAALGFLINNTQVGGSAVDIEFDRLGIPSGYIGADAANNLTINRGIDGVIALTIDRTTGALSLLAPLFPVKDDLTVQATAGIYAGAGVPSNANGANGNFYFRSDTPGVANQRIYEKSAGAWVGIV